MYQHPDKDGFDPQTAAYEPVLTVRHYAVRGNIFRSMPPGAVRILPGDEDEKLINTDAVQDAKNAGS